MVLIESISAKYDNTICMFVIVCYHDDKSKAPVSMSHDQIAYLVVNQSFYDI